MKNVIYSDIECYMDRINKKIDDNIYKISDHVRIAVGFSWGTNDEAPDNGIYKSSFGPDCIKDYVKDLLEIETENNFKLHNTMYLMKKINYMMIPITHVIVVINLALLKLEITPTKLASIEALHVKFAT